MERDKLTVHEELNEAPESLLFATELGTGVVSRSQNHFHLAVINACYYLFQVFGSNIEQRKL